MEELEGQIWTEQLEGELIMRKVDRLRETMDGGGIAVTLERRGSMIFVTCRGNSPSDPGLSKRFSITGHV
jgi:hypothetical protein